MQNVSREKYQCGYKNNDRETERPNRNTEHENATLSLFNVCIYRIVTRTKGENVLTALSHANNIEFFCTRIAMPSLYHVYIGFYPLSPDENPLCLVQHICI